MLFVEINLPSKNLVGILIATRAPIKQILLLESEAFQPVRLRVQHSELGRVLAVDRAHDFLSGVQVGKPSLVQNQVVSPLEPLLEGDCDRGCLLVVAIQKLLLELCRFSLRAHFFGQTGYHEFDRCVLILPAHCLVSGSSVDLVKRDCYCLLSVVC
jgi:hypothetical protein